MPLARAVAARNAAPLAIRSKSEESSGNPSAAAWSAILLCGEGFMCAIFGVMKTTTSFTRKERARIVPRETSLRLPERQTTLRRDRARTCSFASGGRSLCEWQAPHVNVSRETSMLAGCEGRGVYCLGEIAPLARARPVSHGKDDCCPAWRVREYWAVVLLCSSASNALKQLVLDRNKCMQRTRRESLSSAARQPCAGTVAFVDRHEPRTGAAATHG